MRLQQLSVVYIHVKVIPRGAAVVFCICTEFDITANEKFNKTQSYSWKTPVGILSGTCENSLV